MAWGRWKSLRSWHDLESVESIGLALASEKKMYTEAGTNALPLSKRLYGDIRGCMYASWLNPACRSMLLSCVVCRMLPPAIWPSYMIQPKRGSAAQYSGWIAIFDQHATPWNKLNPQVKLTCRVMSPSVNILWFTPEHWKTCHTLPRRSLEALGSGFVGRSEVEWQRRVENFPPRSLHLEAIDKENSLTTEKRLWHLRAFDSCAKCQKHNSGIKVAIERRTCQWPKRC